MSTVRLRRRGRWLTRVVVTVVVVLLALVAAWQVNGAIARDDVRVYPLGLVCDGEKMPIESPMMDETDEDDTDLTGPVLSANLTNTKHCQVYVKVTNQSHSPVTVRSADLEALARSPENGGYWEVVRDWSGRRAEVVGQDARFTLSETLEPGEAWTYSFFLQHRANTSFCKDLIVTQRLPRLNLSVYGARGSELADVWVRTTADRSLGVGRADC